MGITSHKSRSVGGLVVVLDLFIELEKQLELQDPFLKLDTFPIVGVRLFGLDADRGVVVHIGSKGRLVSGTEARHLKGIHNVEILENSGWVSRMTSG
ncbi:unnamed protein product [Periconia digitata]|uniref:Uncharacterized protein n=1 Tax=Periconia digitata TaxID=1303443 RepID=A0A9W4XQY8_9PLEO|nr:unnamed protein product [Periconia digitata]